MKKKWIWRTVLFAVTLSLSACGSSGKGEDTSPAAAETGAREAGEDSERKDKEPEGNQNGEALDGENRKEESPDGDGLGGENGGSEQKQGNDGRSAEAGLKSLRVSDNGYNDLDWDEDLQQIIFQISASRLQVRDDGYRQLNEALDDYWSKAWEEVKQWHDENYDVAVESARDRGMSCYELSRTAQVIRGDSQVFSFLDMDYSYLGGAHPFTATHGVTFDSATGRRLSLQDVTDDYQGLCAYIKSYLEEMNQENGGYMLFDWYEEELEKYFSGEEELSWVMGPEGITVYFDPYVLASYADGTLEVPVTYKEHPEFFGQGYDFKETTTIVRGQPDWFVTLDIDGDGNEDQISVSSQENADEGTYTIEVRVNDRSAGYEEYGRIFGYWVLCGENGKTWCYVQCFGDNDWPVIDVFELSGGAPVYVDHLYSMAMQEPAADIHDFCIATRVDFLGSYSGYRNYSLGDDGMPVANSDEYDIYDYGMDGYLTTKRELPAVIYRAGNDTDGEEGKIPAGARLYPRSTDGKSWMMMETEDGNLCRITLTGEPYSLTVDGADEQECFEGLFYAG